MRGVLGEESALRGCMQPVWKCRNGPTGICPTLPRDGHAYRYKTSSYNS